MDADSAGTAGLPAGGRIATKAQEQAMQQINSNAQVLPGREPAPLPVEPPLPDWKNPEHLPKVPFEPVRPAIHPTEPWPDPEPKREPPRK